MMKSESHAPESAPGSTELLIPVRRTRCREALRVVGINGAILGIGIALLELAFGDWFSEFIPPYGAIVNRTFTYEQRLYQPPGLVTYSRDRFGLRSTPNQLERIDIVTVGGSTTDQRYISDGQTWQDVIMELSAITTVNAGVDGLSSTGHVYAVRNWLHRIQGLRPRAYLHYLGINDALYIYGVSRNDASVEARLHSLLERQRDGLAFDVLLRSRSAIYRSYLRLTAWLAGPPVIMTTKPPTEVFRPAEGDRELVRQFVETIYKPNMLELFALHRSRGEKVILVSQPAHPGMYRLTGAVISTTERHMGQWAIALAMINDVTEALCKAHAPDCAFIDLAKKLSLEADDYYDFIHASPAGARRIGAFLASELSTLRPWFTGLAPVDGSGGENRELR